MVRVAPMVWIALLVASAVLALETRQVCRRAMAATVTVKTKAASAQGIVIDARRGLVLTTARAVHGAATVEIGNGTGATRRGLVRRHPRHRHMRHHASMKLETAAKQAKAGIWKR